MPLLVVDNVIMDIEYLEMFSLYEIAQIDVLKDPDVAVFGSRGANGVIPIFTKRGETGIKNSSVYHIRTLIPLGYQQPVEFYAPNQVRYA